jgi:L-alanine-DL-glutamate epimerase-like enolase superfamily enzyme
MTIWKIDVWDFRPTFKDGPYAMSHVTVGQIYGRILRVQGVDGSSGIGEIVFSPSLLEAEREQRIRDEDRYLKSLIGEHFDTLLDVASDTQSRDKSWRGIAFALETAWLDREGKRTNQSASQLLGGALQAEVPDYFSISENEVSRIRKRVNIAGPDCKVFQLKLGVGSLEQDIVQIGAFLDMMTDEQIVQADANGGWTVDEACDIIGRFDDERIIWEEPCTTYEDNVTVARKTARHVMVDQCVGDPDMAIRAIDECVAQSICIKPAPLGGLMIARQVRDHAIEAGMRVRIDGPWCGDIATAAILHLAVGMPGDLLISGCDLREPVAIPVDLNGVRHAGGNKIAPPAGFGLGITLPDNLLGPPERSIGAM